MKTHALLVLILVSFLFPASAQEKAKHDIAVSVTTATGAYVDIYDLKSGQKKARVVDIQSADKIEQRFHDLTYHNKTLHIIKGQFRPKLLSITKSLPAYTGAEGWRFQNSGRIGGLARIDGVIYTSDMWLATEHSTGIVSFDTTATPIKAERFDETFEAIDLAEGNEKTVLLLDAQGRIAQFDPASKQITIIESSVNSIEFSASCLCMIDEKTCAIGSHNGVIYLFDIAGFSRLRGMRINDTSICDLDVVDEKIIIGTDRTGIIYVADTTSGSELRPITICPGIPATIFTCAFPKAEEKVEEKSPARKLPVIRRSMITAR